jgi:hypothetical protein
MHQHVPFVQEEAAAAKRYSELQAAAVRTIDEQEQTVNITLTHRPYTKCIWQTYHGDITCSQAYHMQLHAVCCDSWKAGCHHLNLVESL